jgi:hypothetical protein
MNAANPPQINVMLGGQNAGVPGWTSGMAIVSSNGDLFYTAPDRQIRSLIQATRFFGEEGNTTISSNEQRILSKVNANLLNFANGVFFDNRMLMAMFPQQTPYGVVHTAVIPLDFEPLSTLEEQLPACWEGEREGLQIFQLLTGNFNGVSRCFAVVLNSNNPGEIDLYENVIGSNSDYNFNGTERRIEWQSEFPAFTWNKENDLKSVQNARLWIDKLKGVCAFTVEWRPDASECWHLWRQWQVCSARNSGELLFDPVAYPLVIYPPGYRMPMTLPLPPDVCAPQMKRPASVAFQIQTRITVTGFCRIRGWFVGANDVEMSAYQDLLC